MSHLRWVKSTARTQKGGTREELWNLTPLDKVLRATDSALSWTMKGFSAGLKETNFYCCSHLLYEVSFSFTFSQIPPSELEFHAFVSKLCYVVNVKAYIITKRAGLDVSRRTCVLCNGTGSSLNLPDAFITIQYISNYKWGFSYTVYYLSAKTN